MTLIGLVGFISSGKGTAAACLEQLGCRHDSFAAPLKDLVSAVFGWPRHLLEGDTPESREFRETPDVYWTRKTGINNFTPRLAMQLIGTDVMRDQFHKDIWLNSLEYRLRCVNKGPTVVSDARFRNELDLIKSLGGATVWVQRGDLPEWYDLAVSANSGNSVARHKMNTTWSHIHSSEWDWCGYDFDYVVSNNGTVEDLNSKMITVFEGIAHKKTKSAMMTPIYHS